MPLRSTAPTIGAMTGNDRLDRANALVREMRIDARHSADARQEAVLAELEGRDPRKAIRCYVRLETWQGMTGYSSPEEKAPAQLSMSDKRIENEAAIANDDPETVLVRRENQLRREEIAGAVFERLTPREQEIVRLRARGWTQTEIAVHLGLNQSSVARQCAKIAAKSLGKK